MLSIKTTRQVNVFPVCLGLILIPTLANAGAWVPEQGEGYAKFAYTAYSANDRFGSNDPVDFEGNNTSYYGEYGIGGNLGLYWSFIYQDIEQTVDGNTTSNSGLSDVELGARYQWFSEPFVFSTSFLAKLPYLYDEEDELPLGNGQEDFEVRALIGKGLSRFGYFGIEVGYRLRTDEPSDEYRYLLEYGFSVNDNLYLRTKLDGIESVGNADSGGVEGNLSLAPEFDLGKLELTAGWNFGAKNDSERWGIEITYTDEIYGTDTLQGDSIQLGLTRTF